MNPMATHRFGPFLSQGALVGALPLLLAATLVSGSVQAQSVYRIVGPDGKVTFSDQPPAAGSAPKGVSGGAAASPGGGGLPLELRQVSGRYPVTLYTAPDCAPCNSGRNLLNARGIPYAEKTISSNDDSNALKRLAGDSSVPLLTIGGQQIKGFSDGEWSQYLDAAGYPKTSKLPPNYRRPAAAPLVAVKAAEPAGPAPRAAANAPAREETPAETPVAPPVTNPSGIRF